VKTSDNRLSSGVDEENWLSQPHEDGHEPDKLYFLATQDGLTVPTAFDEWRPGI
jgi:hypothetical protein